MLYLTWLNFTTMTSFKGTFEHIMTLNWSTTPPVPTCTSTCPASYRCSSISDASVRSDPGAGASERTDAAGELLVLFLCELGGNTWRLMCQRNEVTQTQAVAPATTHGLWPLDSGFEAGAAEIPFSELANWVTVQPLIPCDRSSRGFYGFGQWLVWC